MVQYTEFNKIESKIIFEVKKISITTRKKLYLILGNLSLILLFYSIWETKPVIVNLNSYLGLTSHLPINYWIGLFLIILCSIFIYFDNELKEDTIYIFILIIFGLFLFGVAIFVEENARWWDSYYPISEVKNILSLGYIEISPKYPSSSYYNWPGYHLITAFLISFSNFQLISIIKYMPLFNILTIIFLTYTIGKKLEFSLNQCFLLSYLLLSSLWVTTLYYYGPQAMAYILSLVIFLFLVQFKNTAKEKVIIVLTFLSIVITHALTTIVAVLSPMIISSFYKKQSKIRLFFIVFFIGWYIYLLPAILEVGIKSFIYQIINMDFYFLKNTPTFIPITPIKTIINNFRLSYLIIFLIYTVAVFIEYLAGYVKKENLVNIKICALWLIGISLFALYNYDSTAFVRYYIFGLVPLICIIILSFSNKYFFIPLIILLAVLHIPAHYGDESFVMTRTSELKGSEFFSSINVSSTYTCYHWSTQHVFFYKPALLFESIANEEKGWKKKCIFYYPISDDISILANTNYVIDTIQTDNMMKYLMNFNPISEWLTNNRQDFSKIYTSKFYNIYYRKQKEMK